VPPLTPSPVAEAVGEGRGEGAANPLVIRPATPADAEAIARLADELNADQGEPTGFFTPDLIRREAFGDHPEFRLLVAERGGEVVGYALFHPTFASELGMRGLYIYDLAVTAGARGQGIGRALVAGVARLAKEEGRGFLWWSTKAGNEAARAFYARLGAEEEESRVHALVGEAFDRIAQRPFEKSGCG
jgi:ribosomal protein S18 acetylase RimI-like enzyme